MRVVTPPLGCVGPPGLVGGLVEVERGALRLVAEAEGGAGQLVAVAQRGAVLVERVALHPLGRVGRGVAGGRHAAHVGTQDGVGQCGTGGQGGSGAGACRARQRQAAKVHGGRSPRARADGQRRSDNEHRCRNLSRAPPVSVHGVPRRSVLTLAIAALGTGAPAAGAAPVAVSGPTPFTQGCPGVAAGQTPSSEAEPYAAVDPADASRIVVVFQQDRFPVDGGALTNQYAVSDDGGRMFADKPFPQLSKCTGGAKERASDPWVGFGPGGVAYAANLTFDENPALGQAGLAGPTGLFSQTSADGGRTWSTPPSTIVDQSIYDDREAITPDPRHAGVVYASWVRRLGSFGESGSLEVSKSVDGGKTWSAGTTVYVPGPAKLPDPILIEALPDGSLVATFVVIDATYAVSSDPKAFDLYTTRSTDAGATWSAPARFGSTISTTPHDPDTTAEIRSLPIVATAVGGDGALYVAWNKIISSSASEIHLERSSDGGASFTDILVAHPAGQAFLPAVAVLKDGTVGVLWDDTRNDRPNDHQLTTDVWLGLRRSTGAAWREKHVAGPFDALTASETSSTGVAGHFLGDYQALVALPGAFGAVFAASRPLARTGPSDIFFARVPEAGAAPAPEPRLVIRLSRAHVRAGRRTLVRVRVSARGAPLAGAAVRLSGHRTRTDRRGRAALRVRFARAGTRFVRVSRRGYRAGRAALYVTRASRARRRAAISTR